MNISAEDLGILLGKVTKAAFLDGADAMRSKATSQCLVTASDTSLKHICPLEMARGLSGAIERIGNDEMLELLKRNARSIAETEIHF